MGLFLDNILSGSKLIPFCREFRIEAIEQLILNPLDPIEVCFKFQQTAIQVKGDRVSVDDSSHLACSTDDGTVRNLWMCSGARR